MGKGDKKSKKGKIFKGSYGVSRPRKKKKTVVSKPAAKKAAPKAEEKKAAPKKATAKKATKKAE
ncbi:MAG: 30S ribosomal protein THX [Bacteroidetes bacterium]|nr:30S ribosomal protein THX [Bacteroidota bacterium]